MMAVSAWFIAGRSSGLRCMNGVSGRQRIASVRADESAPGNPVALGYSGAELSSRGSPASGRLQWTMIQMLGNFDTNGPSLYLITYWCWRMMSRMPAGSYRHSWRGASNATSF